MDLGRTIGLIAIVLALALVAGHAQSAEPGVGTNTLTPEPGSQD
jgi:hypothetical protein